MRASRCVTTTLLRALQCNIQLSPLKALVARATLVNRLYSSAVDNTHIARLPDGRDIAYNTYGASNGHPVFYLHGLPGSRIEAAVWHDPAADLGAQVIGIDRPGIGLSSPHPARTILSHAEDIRYLAKHLNHSSYSVLGISGGGPFALACAHLHSSSALRGATLVCGMGPHGVQLTGMRFGNRVFFFYFHYMRWLPRLLARISAAQLHSCKLSDDNFIAVMQKKLRSPFRFSRVSDKDIEVLSDAALMRVFLASAREHFRQGTDAFLEEGRLVTSPIGFDLGKTRVPVRLWYGMQDINVPVLIGEQIARQLPEGTELFVEDESHVSLVVNCRRKVLEDILSRA
ncbi:hypothetical protein LTR53_005062 [Teratosphaeriaceae sp. CCFEE 6253]|nr:hypothetical protein LTR53_005062 [Teratosphaeriaceae sp. CCFEE 6253]